MKKVKQKKQPPRRFTDLVGVDFSTTATKVVRLKKTKDEITLLGIDLLPSVDFGTASHKIELPRNMVAHYGCLTYSGAAAIVRMVNAPLPAEQDALPDAKLRELLNISDEYRVAAMLAKRGKGRQDSSFLAAAIPQDDVRFLLKLFPSGPPAPASVEVAGLSFVSAFLNARGEECKNEAVCLVEAGDSVSHYAILNKGAVALVGKFAFGGSMLRSKIVEDLGVDEELAETILADHSINITTSMSDVMTPFLKQLSISKDFIERHQGCRISKVYTSGGLSLMPHWSSVVEQVLGSSVVPWSPLENIQYDPEIVPEHLIAQATRFAAAIGAAIGGFEES